MGVSSAIYYLTKNGYTVCLPLSDSQSYDLVVDINGILSKVQVKTTTHKRFGKYQVSLKTTGGNRSGTGKTKKLDAENLDFLFILTNENVNYFIPISELGGVSNISLCERYSRFIVN